MVRRTIYILIGAIVLVVILIAVGIFVLIPKITSASGSLGSQAATPTVVASTATPTHKTNKVTQILRQYAPSINSQVSQGLHVTPDQLRTQLRAGKTLSEIATAQGVSATQLQTLISNAVKTSLQPAVSSGELTQKQVDNLAKRYTNQPLLLERLLKSKYAVQGTTATPTP